VGITPNTGSGNMGRRNAIKKALKLGGAAYVAPAVLTTVIPAMAVGAVTAPPAMSVITRVAPGSGPTTGGTTVVITGSGFVPGSTILFGGTPLTGVTIVNGTTITGVTPPGTAGTVPVTILTPGGGTFTLNNGFTYTPVGGDGGTAPTIGTINPNNGPTTGGTGVTITGTGFTPGATVVIGGTPATGVTVVNPTTITANTPPGTVGPANVTVTNPNGQSTILPNGFTYTATATGGAAPTVGTITPNSGPTTGGTPITITGTGFTPGSTVNVGGTPATGVTVVNPTTITATTPPGVPGGAPVTVTTPNGTGTGTFTYRTITATGQAFGATASALGVVTLPPVALATLPPGQTVNFIGTTVPGVITTGPITDSALNISSTTPGFVTAQSTSTVGTTSVPVAGLSTTGVTAQTTSTSNGTTASSTATFTGTVTANGQTFNLANTAPNTVVNIAGVGSLTLNRVVTTTTGANFTQTATAFSFQAVPTLLGAGTTTDVASATSTVATT